MRWGLVVPMAGMSVLGGPVARWRHSAGFLNCHQKADKFLIRAFAVFGEMAVVCERWSADLES